LAADSPLDSSHGWVLLENREFYRIANYDQLPPFLMSIVSESDRWLYISSNGGLTAGRIDADHALFPYETEDRLHDAHGSCGPHTIVRVKRGAAAAQIWEPFTAAALDRPTTRNLYKSLHGNEICFEEIHHGLGLTFRYRWTGSDEFGFVRTATLVNDDLVEPVQVEWLDGLRNILPAGITLPQQQRFSSLTDAYKYSELDLATGIGIFALATLLTDRAEPAEALEANIVWACGVQPAACLLTTDQLDQFRRGEAVTTEPVLKGGRGNYFVTAGAQLAAGQASTWQLVANVAQSQIQVEALRARLQSDPQIAQAVRASVIAGDRELTRIVASADGLQATAAPLANAHHFANVLFNVMRGGIFADNYSVDIEDFAAFVRQRNRPAWERLRTNLPCADSLAYDQLLARLQTSGDADLIRLGYEYLPLTFSRRHGDPSRPWNSFNIRVKQRDGRPLLDYQGNWRDIFQNWEALTASYPLFLRSIIAKFVNASTVDGFNPYRVSREGIDWEVPDPHDPWANIGYWGDHQLIYLLKFLEAAWRLQPTELVNFLAQPVCSYANVPYRLKSFADTVANPRDTIEFDVARAKQIAARVEQIGSDGRLVLAADGQVHYGTLLEKLLVSVLARLGNLVVDGGIWLNTQRPEWNDANNALVGNGVSVVTLCHLRRYLAFLRELVAGAATEFSLAGEVAQWLAQTVNALQTQRGILTAAVVSDEARYSLLAMLGTTFDQYRQNAYERGFTEPCTLTQGELVEFLDLALAFVDFGVRSNRRPDGLYHAYNLVHVTTGKPSARLGRLQEMLEGQVAALSSGLVGPEETLRLLETMFQSKLYRADQGSFLLYPDRELPRFLQKNVVAPADVWANPLLTALVQAGDTSVIAGDVTGQFRFHSRFANAQELQAALKRLQGQPRFASAVTTHGPAVVELYERTFNHQAFTGRSGGMFAYEGLGCIYWHMVAKLLLAVQERFQAARATSTPAGLLVSLAEMYYRVRQGLGFNKTVERYGAFPMDPYSHTPGHGGARQPGMTGQVKEEILARWGELGVQVVAGCVHFDPALLRQQEFFASAHDWEYINVQGRPERLTLAANSLAFTYCQIPVVYRRVTTDAQITCLDAQGRVTQRVGCALDRAESESVFRRTGQITRIEVDVPETTFLLD